MKKFFYIAVLAIVIIGGVLLISNSKADEKVFTEKASSSINVVSKGQQFLIELAENPTTGFSWHLNIKDSEKISLISDEYIAPKTEALGAGGKHIWRFKALNEGKTSIEFLYYQDWEKDNIEESYTFDFDIK